MNVNWEIIGATTFITVGIIQWAKGIFPNAHTKVWTWAFPPACFGFYAIVIYLPAWVSGGLLVWAAGQLGYENIVQVIKNKLGGGKEAEK